MLRVLKILTAGESHGQALLTIVEGMPSGLPISAEEIGHHMTRRQKGYGRGRRQQIEKDAAQILSGVRHGKSIGSPIGMLVGNKDWGNWQEIMAVEPVDTPVKKVTHLRPGHADLVGVFKYGFDDIRPILERSSARETAARLAASGVCRALLSHFGITIASYVSVLGPIEIDASYEVTQNPDAVDWDALEEDPLRCPDPEASRQMVALIDEMKEAGDSLGGVYNVVAWGIPIGLGSHVFWDRRLDSRLAAAILSINATKGVEFGPAFENARRQGSQVQDQIRFEKGRGISRLSNRAGGLEAGISNGEPLLVRGALKPISTIRSPLPSVDLATLEPAQAHYERADTTAVPAAGVIGEAMVAIILADAFLEKFGGDSLTEIERNYQGYLEGLPK